MLPDVEALLDLADEQIAEIEALYNQTLKEHKVSGRLQALIKNAVENYRSALDYVANAVTDTHGKPGRAKVYWPYAVDPARFDGFFDKNMPGVRAARPDLVEAWRTYQPYTPGYEWINALVTLARDNKHRLLTPQTRREQKRREVGGVSWDPATVEFGPGRIGIGSGGITLGPGGSIGFGPGGQVVVGGEVVDPRTQRTPSTVEVIYVDWLFDRLGVSALGTLKRIQAGIRPMLQDLTAQSGL